jgi:DNA polymerase III epsilon subunit-like protein
VPGAPDLFEETHNTCLMKAYKNWRKIFKGYKLSDACQYLGIPYERVHRAPADAMAAVELFRALRERGAEIPAPEIHRHKDYDAIVARGNQ